MKPKWLLLLLTAVFAVAFSLPVAVATDGSTDPSPLLSAADGFAMAGETLYFTVGMKTAASRLWGRESTVSSRATPRRFTFSISDAAP